MGKEKGEKKVAPGAKPVADARFAAMHSDPRFSRFPKKKHHVEIDERFKGAPRKPTAWKRCRGSCRSRRGVCRCICKIVTSQPIHNLIFYVRLRTLMVRLPRGHVLHGATAGRSCLPRLPF